MQCKKNYFNPLGGVSFYNFRPEFRNRNFRGHVLFLPTKTLLRNYDHMMHTYAKIFTIHVLVWQLKEEFFKNSDRKK